MVNKKAQSQVISTVLLILLVIVAIGIISSFAVSFIRDKLSEEDCLEVYDKVKIGNRYTCYDSTNTMMRVQIQIGNINTTIDGFKVELGGADSKTVEVSEGSNEVSMFLGDYEVVVLPGNNEARTYNITSDSFVPDFVSVYPVLSGGKVCDSTDILNIIADC